MPFPPPNYVESIGWGVVSLNEHQPTQLNAAIADLRLTAGTFNLNLLETKNRIDAINGSKAVVEFEIQYNGQQAPKDVFERVWGEGNSSVNDWLSGTLNLLDNIYGKITATASLGKTAADDGKKKAKQIESALHSVESELNRLQMTDAQYKQWQVDEKVEKLEKLLGSTNPKVIELRTSLQKELNDNLFKDVLKFANPAAAAVATVEKEYDDWKKNLEQLKKQAPDKYAKLMAENINLMANAQRQYNNALEQAKSTFINFRKETVDIYAQSTMTDEEYFVYQNNRQIEEWEKQGQSRADIDERVNALLLQRNNKYSADFGKMWEETYNRVDQAGADMLENFLSGTKNTFDSLKKSSSARWLKWQTRHGYGLSPFKSWAHSAASLASAGRRLRMTRLQEKWSMLQVADFSAICRSPTFCPIRGHRGFPVS